MSTVCPKCKKDNNKVVDSRVPDGEEHVWRRRHCLSCSKRWNTVEVPEEELKRLRSKVRKLSWGLVA